MAVPAAHRLLMTMRTGLMVVTMMMSRVYQEILVQMVLLPQPWVQLISSLPSQRTLAVVLRALVVLRVCLVMETLMVAI